MSHTVTVRVLAPLAGTTPGCDRVVFTPGDTVGTLAARLGLAWETVGTVLQNGRPAGAGTLLAADDTISFVPPITGG